MKSGEPEAYRDLMGISSNKSPLETFDSLPVSDTMLRQGTRNDVTFNESYLPISS
jgi:hypothetical protein